MARADQMQAFYEFFGGNATSLAVAASAGATSVTVNTALPLGPVQIDIDESGADYGEIVGASTTSPYTLTLAQPLKRSHAVGAPVTTWSTTAPSPISGIQTVAKGEPLRRDVSAMPYLFVTVPDSSESRNRAYAGAAQVKVIVYTVRATLEQWIEGQLTYGSNRGEQMLNDYYSLLDAIAAHIRTNKQLITTNYPQGAAIEWGEQFTMKERHEASETSLILRTQIDITSVEAVNA